MSESFDPYRAWLGIPPDSRPPTHYELLGISPNEDERAVIEAAVLRQSGYVRNFQLGKYGKDAARILNEIGAAKACLLDPVKRARYDADLRARRRVLAEPAPTNAAAPLPPAIDLGQLATPAAMSVPTTSASRSRQRRLPAPSRRPKRAAPWQIAAAAGGALVLGVVLFFSTLRHPHGKANEHPLIANRDPSDSNAANVDAPSAAAVEMERTPTVVVDTITPPALSAGAPSAAPPLSESPPRVLRVKTDTDTRPDSPDASAVAADKLLAQAVALYRAEGNADDSSGKHHGKLEGDATIVSIKVGHAFKFGGKGVVVVPDSPELNPKEQLTVMAWIRPDVMWWSCVLDKSTSSNGDDWTKKRGWRLSVTDADVWSDFNAPGEAYATNHVQTRLRHYVGRWRHIAATYDGRLLQLYVDGVNAQTTAVGRKSIGVTDAKFVIGGLASPPTGEFKGLVDDAALFRRGLSNTEIETLYRGTRAGKEWLTPEQKAALAQHTNERTIDVLALVDPARDARSGTWTMDADGLHSPANTSMAALRLPVAVPREYCLTIVAERALASGGNPIFNVGLVAKKQFNSTIDWNGTTGLELIDGNSGHENESTVHCGNLFEDGQTSVLTYIVRQAGVQIFFDGKQVLDWHGGFQRFSLQDGWRLPVNAPLRLYLGTHCNWHFKAILLTPLPGAPTASAAARQPGTNLLKTIEPQKHARGGWGFDGSTLVSPANVSHAGVRFPGVAPDEYHLRIVAERPRGFQGPPQLHLGLVTRLSQATLVLDADHKSGLEAVGGKMYHENPATFQGDLFIDGVESTIDCLVDQESIRVDFDGQTIIDWSGDLRQLTPTWSEFGAPKRNFWIGTHCNWRIKKMELLPAAKKP